MPLTLRKKNGSMVPRLVNDFFERPSLFGREFLDLESDLLGRSRLAVMPEANIIENTKDYKIELAAPGLEKKDFKVEVEDGVLCVSAEKKEEKKEEKENYMRREFAFNSFSRSFTLPENCISDKIDAKYENGILHLSLPKKEVTVLKPKKEIKIS